MFALDGLTHKLYKHTNSHKCLKAYLQQSRCVTKWYVYNPDVTDDDADGDDDDGMGLRRELETCMQISVRMNEQTLMHTLLSYTHRNTFNMQCLK